MNITQALPEAPPADLVELGRIVAAHGVRGEVKVAPHAAQSSILLSQKIWWLQAMPAVASGAASAIASNPARAVHVRACQRHNAVLVALIEGVADRDQAHALKGATLHVPRSAFPKADDDEYYWVDLIGCDVYGKIADAQDVLLGQVTQVSDNGAHAVLHVGQPAAEATQHGKQRAPEHLIPFVAAHITHVCLAERRIASDWPADF